MKLNLKKKASEPDKPATPEQTKFISQLKFSINQKFAEVLAAKEAAKASQKSAETGGKNNKEESDPALITLLDATTITNYVRAIFTKRLSLVPPPVEAALVLSEATVAPSTIKKLKMFKRAVGLAGGLGGLGTIAIAIMAGLGVGTTATLPTIWATVAAWFTTTTASTAMPYLWPVAIGLGGAGIAAFAVYFSASGNSEEQAEKFKNALLNSCEKAVAKIWDEYGDKLS